MHSTAAWSSLTVGGSLAGEIRVDGSSWGSIIIQEDITADGQLSVDSLGGYYDSIRVWWNHAGEIVVQDIVGDEADINLNAYGGVTSGLLSVGTIVGPEFGVSVMGDLTSTGEITVGSNSGSVYVSGDNSGNISVGQLRGYLGGGANVSSSARISVGSMSPGPNPARIQVRRDFDGVIDIENTVDGEITLNYLGGNTRGDVLIGGALLGSIDLGGQLDGGRIYVDGALTNGVPGEEITVRGQMLVDAAIAVDYDGWHASDRWQTGATVSVNGVPYYGNTPEMRIWEIQPCKGDMNNNDSEGLDSEDPDILWHVVNDPQYDYAEEFPGLEGSLWWHGDLDCSGEIDGADVGAVAFFAGDPGNTCCQSDPECAQYEVCRADLNRSGSVDLPDLAGLLAAYGSQQGDPNYNPDADLDSDEDVDLADLAWLLTEYGNPCDCFAAQPEGFAPEGAGFGAPPPIQVWFQAIDTGGYSGGGFNGEVDHFIFDLKVEVNDPNNDWTATGAVLQARNSATFRLSTTPTTPDAYATFVGAPWTTIPSGPGATQVIGAYEPPDLTYEFETSGINIGWFDTVDSENGPAAVMRLVIDVSEVEGADTSGGFGSVYFSKTGPVNPEDILVADVQSETGHCFGGCDMHPLNGSFYVKGE
jgi:hypothetical protein